MWFKTSPLEGAIYSMIYRSYIVNVYVYGEGVAVSTSIADANNYKAYICLEYTKTTD